MTLLLILYRYYINGYLTEMTNILVVNKTDNICFSCLLRVFLVFSTIREDSCWYHQHLSGR